MVFVKIDSSFLLNISLFIFIMCANRGGLVVIILINYGYQNVTMRSGMGGNHDP